MKCCPQNILLLEPICICNKSYKIWLKLCPFLNGVTKYFLLNKSGKLNHSNNFLSTIGDGSGPLSLEYFNKFLPFRISTEFVLSLISIVPEDKNWQSHVIFLKIASWTFCRVILNREEILESYFLLLTFQNITDSNCRFFPLFSEKN